MNMSSPTILRTATILNNGIPAGILQETTEGYTFSYQTDYLEMEHAEPVSLTLPLQVPPFHSPILFSFFDGLIPEGWLLDITTHTWKVDRNDRMGLLLAACRDCIGSVSIKPVSQGEIQ